MTKKHDLYNLALRDKDLMPVIAYGSAVVGNTYGALCAAIDKTGALLICHASADFIGLNPFSIKKRVSFS